MTEWENQDEVNEYQKEAGVLRKSIYDTFTTSSGKYLLEYFKKQYLYRASYVPNDPYAMAFHEGQRDIVRAILDSVETYKQNEVNSYE